MFNFGSVFNALRVSQGPSLSQQLADPGASLGRLLEEDNFVSEFRSGSMQIRQFMTYRRMQELVELVTVVGDPADRKRSYKFPLTAADLLAADLPFVIDKLLPEDGVVVEEERVVRAQECAVDRQLEEEDDDELEMSSSESSREERVDEKESPSEQPTRGEEEDEFGDYIATPVKEKRSVRVKEIVQTETMVKREHPGLMIKLLDYFNSPINYTLTSYTCRVLTALLNKRPAKFLEKLFQNDHYTAAILTHIESRSTVEFLIRLFTIETGDYLESRVALLKSMASSLSVPQETNVMSNISAALCETFQKVNGNARSASPCKELQVYLHCIPAMLEDAVRNIISEHEAVCAYSVGFLYILINSLPSELDNDDIDIVLFRFVEGAVRKLGQAIEEKRSRLGVGRVRMLEILNFILKRSKIQEYLSQVQFFPILFSIIRGHPLNNILHHEAFKLITAILAPSNGLIHSLIQGSKLIDWLSLEAEEESQRISDGKIKHSKGYAGHLLNLCKSLKQAGLTNAIVSQFTSDPRFANIYSELVEKPSQLIQRDLGGFATHKTDKLQIMTSRQEILKHYQTFLASARPAVFETDPDFCSPILLEELQRQLDGIQFESNEESRPKEVIEEQKHKAELIEENEQHKSAFWKMHLEYDVDDLMDEVM